MSWEAIRAFATEVQRREKKGVDSNDRNSNRWYYAKAVTAAREAQALLKECDRAVELLRMAIENEDRDPANGCSMRDYENWLSKVRAILRELEGSDRDHERANETGKIEENK